MNDRSVWLARLKIGDPVDLHTPFGIRWGKVSALGDKWISVDWLTAGGGPLTTRLHRDAGNLPGGRLFSAPPPADPNTDTLQAIGADPGAVRDARPGGWEAA